MAELYVCSSDDGKNTLRVTSKGDGDCTLELSWKKDDKSERITNRIKLSKKALRGGMYEGGLLERIGLIGKKKVAIFDESDGIFLEKEERFKRMNSMVKKTKYRGGMQEYLALKTVRSTIDEANGNFIIFELGLKRCAKQVTSTDSVYSNIVQVAPAFTYLDIRQWKDNKATKSGIRIPEVLLLKLMMEKEIGHGQLKDDDEGEDPPPRKRRRIERRVEEKVEEKVEEGEGIPHPPPPMFNLTVVQMSRKFLNARVERVRESETTLKAFIKVCHKLLLLKSRELCDGCGINYANILQRMKDASGETPIENIVGAIRDGEVGYEEHHRFDCLVSDPLRFATFHVAFVLALAAMESADSFSKKMLEMDDQVDAESIARLYELIQGAAIGRKKEAKLEGFLFNITNILLSELDPTIV